MLCGVTNPLKLKYYLTSQLSETISIGSRPIDWPASRQSKSGRKWTKSSG